ncbi:hypothetical protein ABXT01_13505 [Flavobacterium columnare]|uniref:hypothetical protein n=1 Tax=Flavobacterium columnare TaxID=996 RepID=UPI00269DB725
MIFILISCNREINCKITPIDKHIIDVKSFSNDVFLENSNGVMKKLKVEYFYNEIINNQKKSILNNEECGHYIGVNYLLEKESIGVNIVKDKSNIYYYKINGFCFDEEYIFNEKQIKTPKEIKIKITLCHNKTSLKSITLKGFKIISIETLDGNTYFLAGPSVF